MKNVFSKINYGVIIAIASYILIYFLFGKNIENLTNSNIYDYNPFGRLILGIFIWGWQLFVPGIIILGMITFAYYAFQYTKKKQPGNIIKLRNIGGMIGIVWFIFITLAIVILVGLMYKGECGGGFWGTPYPCTLIAYLIDVLFRTNFIPIFWYINIWFLVAPISMYAFGYCMDRKIEKRNQQ